MFGIGHLLKKTQNRQTREFFVREIVRSVLKEVVGIDISIENIKVKESVANLANVSQSAKSEIYIKKRQLLKLINERQNISAITDLR
jgi:hypothetical protein